MERLKYDPATGVFVWRQTFARVAAGQPAGRKSKGYIIIKIDQEEYGAHRLAWLYMTGEWPERQVDHKDRNRSNNCWLNLRPATNKQNHENLPLLASNTSGHRGVRWEHGRGKWFSFITHNQQMKNLGRFGCLIDAVAARLRAERALFTHSEVCA